MNKDLISMMDLQKDEILDILNLADQLKYNLRHSLEHNYLKGKTLAMIFEKASTRTRVSFEAGMYQLGGHALNLSSRDLQMGRGEPIEDTARVLSRYCDAIMIRTFSQNMVLELAKYSSVPVINGLTDLEHPCQILADLMTIRERKAVLEGLKAAWIGDGNNVANSLIIGGLKCGMTIHCACPEGYLPDETALSFAKAYGEKFKLTQSPEEAAQDADVLFTDVWASMGQESERQKRVNDLKDYRISKELMRLAAPQAMVQHCLPAHKGEEIDADVFEEHADEIFEEAENRMHAQKAVLTRLIGEDI